MRTVIVRTQAELDAALESSRTGWVDIEIRSEILAVGIKVADLRPILDGVAKCKAPKVVRACVEVDIDGKPLTRKETS